MVGIRECLHNTVIRNGDRRMSPFIGTLHNILSLGNTVHIAHLRMAVKLHPFSCTVITSGGGKVRDLLYPGQRTDGQFIVKFIDSGNPFELYKGAHLNPLRDLLHLVIVCKELNGHGIGKIRHIKHQDRSFILNLPGIIVDDLTADHHLANFTDDILDGHCFLFKIPAVNHVGIVGALYRTLEIALASLFVISLAQSLLVPHKDACFSVLGHGIRALSASLFRRDCRSKCRIRKGSVILTRIGMCLYSSRCPCRNLSNLAFHFKVVFFLVLAGLLFLVVNPAGNSKATAFIKNLFQNSDNLCRLAVGYHRILDGEHHFRFPGEGNICPLKQIILYRAIVPQLQQNTVLISIHQFLRTVLL